MRVTSSSKSLGLTRLIATAIVVLVVSACATRPYDGTQLTSASFLQRAIVQQQGDITVYTAVPDAAETLALTGLDLYEQGIQPVWLKVVNNGEHRARVVTWSIDKDYYSPIEVAYMNRKKFSRQGYDDMQRWFYDNGLSRFTPPGETTSGLVFTHLRRGSKGFNLSIMTNRAQHDFTFFVPMPGFTADFSTVDFAGLYDESEIRHFGNDNLQQALEREFPCCVTDPSGEQWGGPLNAILVGSGMAIRRAMLRGGWLETSAEDEIREKANLQHYLGRPPDGIFSQLREDGNERIQIHLWMSPWRYKGEPVWVATVFYFTLEADLFGGFADNMQNWEPHIRSLFMNESVSSDVDSAKNFLFQNLWYNGSLKGVGFVRGMPPISRDELEMTFAGIPYFTNGLRLVARLSEDPLALDETNFLFELLPSPPVSEVEP